MQKDRFTLYTQYPKEKKIGAGRLNIFDNGEALFLINGGKDIIKEMYGVKLVSAGSDVISISGFEPKGLDRFVPQVWRLVYV
jgi:hypothetical protein